MSLLFYTAMMLSVVALASPGTALAITLENPLKVNSIEGLFEAILEIMLVLAVPIIVFFIIYAGFKYVTAQGKEDELKKANQMLLWSIVGGLII